MQSPKEEKPRGNNGTSHNTQTSSSSHSALVTYQQEQHQKWLKANNANSTHTIKVEDNLSDVESFILEEVLKQSLQGEEISSEEERKSEKRKRMEQKNEEVKQKKRKESYAEDLDDVLGALYSQEELLSVLLPSLGTPILRSSFDSLLGSRDISGEVISTFFHLLGFLYPPHQVLDTYFSSYLAEWYQPHQGEEKTKVGEEEELLQGIHYREEKLKSYSSKIQWESLAMVLIPIHTPGHWILAVLNLELLQIELWNSTTSDETLSLFWKQALAAWLHSANFIPSTLLSRLSSTPLTFLSATRGVFHQKSGNDCGAFICFYALQRLKGETVHGLRRNPLCHPLYMQLFRKYLRRYLEPFCEPQSEVIVVH